MSSMWEVVIWSKHADKLMPELESFAEKHDRSAGFLRPFSPSFVPNLTPGEVDIITGEVNHLEPMSLLEVIKSVHAVERYLYPATVLVHSEYAMGEPPTVYQLNEDGIWR